MFRSLINKQAQQETTKARGDRGEDAALAHLQAAGLRLVARNYRTPGRGGGEIDLIMCEPGGTLVFVEVRTRASAGFGGAAGSVSAAKRQRIVWAARHFLAAYRTPPPCRFDVLSCQGAQIHWLRAAFAAD